MRGDIFEIEPKLYHFMLEINKQYVKKSKLRQMGTSFLPKEIIYVTSFLLPKTTRPFHNGD